LCHGSREEWRSRAGRTVGGGKLKRGRGRMSNYEKLGSGVAWEAVEITVKYASTEDTENGGRGGFLVFLKDLLDSSSN